jgi:pimeloyl-ACP methyl ester carboxylesterase
MNPMGPPRGEPYYFGPSDGLFGVYHQPAGPVRRTGAVVLCYPSGHEYQRVHRAFRNLAVALSRSGFPVLRFDYFGTGDSAGGERDATLTRWVGDVGSAVDEVTRRSGARKVSLVGLRLGATLAALQSAHRSDLDVLVLWEPVLRGAAYLQQLRQLERAWLSDPSRTASRRNGDEVRPLIGTITREMETEIASIDLTTGPLPRANRAFTLFEADCPEEAGWRDRFRAAYGANSCGVLPANGDWRNPQSLHVALYPQAAQRTVVTLFEQVAM